MDIPYFTTTSVTAIEDSDEEDYIAFIYDENNKPSGILTGGDVEDMSRMLKFKHNTMNQRYILVKVIENYSGQTVH